MTSGSEMGHIIRFALPLLGGNILQQTYSITDTVILGKFLGDNAIAAVGATGSITYLFYTLCIGLSIGTGVIVSQLFGVGDFKRLRAAVFNSAVATAFFGIAVSVISALAAEPILRLLSVPDSLIADSALYMRIACGGTVAVAAYNWINAVMRAMGDSKTPLIFLGIASVINVALDLLFVVVLGTGIGGAAAATVLAQGISAAVCIIYCFRSYGELKYSKGELRPDKSLIRKCVSVGIPIALQNGLVSVSMVALQRVTNGFGEVVMTSYTISMRIEQFIQQPFSSLNAAVSTFIGQNIGANKSDRAINGLKAAIKLSTAFSFVVLAVYIFFSKYIIGMFSDSAEIVDIVSKALLITGSFYWSLGIIHTVRGFLNGAGDTGFALINGLTEVICRVGLSLLLTSIASVGMWGIWITTACTWFATGAISFIRYRSGKWKDRAFVKK